MIFPKKLIPQKKFDIISTLLKKKLIGNEAIFSCASFERVKGVELYKKANPKNKFFLFCHIQINTGIPIHSL